MKMRFLNSYEPNVEAAILLLKELKVKVSETTINETLNNHPDYPSLLSISDSLNKWKIENLALRIETKDLENLETPFLTYIIENSRKEALIVVKKFDNGHIFYKKNIGQKNDIIKSTKDFLKEWGGVIILTKPNELSGEKDFKKHKKKEIAYRINSFFLVAIFFVIGIFVIANIWIHSNVQPKFIFGLSTLLLLKIIGIFTTLLLLLYEIDKANPALQKICTGFAKTNCNAILSSRQAKLFGAISWSEIGFFYFVVGFISLLFVNNSSSGILTAITWLNVAALPYTFFSVYFQWRVAKQWCILCLTVQLLLILEFFVAITSQFLFPVNLIYLLEISYILIVIFTLICLWVFIKPVLFKLRRLKDIKTEFLRLKFDNEIFSSLLEKQSQISSPTDSLGILLGNLIASNTLIKICNPFCGPCAKAHPEIESLLESNQDLKVQIIFNVDNQENEIGSTLVKHFLLIDQEGNKKTISKALNYWYNNPAKNYSQFLDLYPLNEELNNQNYKVHQMYEWCTKMGITSTPTYFLNGRKLPAIYSISDLNYFLLSEFQTKFR